MMRSTPLRPKGWKPARQAKQIGYTPKPRPVARSDAQLPAAAAIPKTPDRRSDAIRRSARGRDCEVRIIGGCSRDPERTIWSHAPLGAAGKGRGIKAIDLAGAYCCTACDAIVDGQAPLPDGATRESVILDWCIGHLRSLVILKQEGLA